MLAHKLGLMSRFSIAMDMTLLGAFPRSRNWCTRCRSLQPNALPIAQLPAKPGLKASALNRSVNSLEHIDGVVGRLGGPDCLDDPASLTPIVAYVGEVTRQATGGRREP